MADTFGSRFRNAWSVFRGKDQPEMFITQSQELGASYSYRPDRVRLSRGTERSFVSSIFNRIAIDVAANAIHHVRLDENQRFVETIKSGLDNALSLSANIDQTGRAFIQDVAMSLFDEGCVAIVPVDKTMDLTDILTLRVGRITQWYPAHVKVEIYNEKLGIKQERILAKDYVAIVENPLYSVMNGPNSTLTRLIKKLNLLDAIDEQSGSGKLDIIIQLPYSIRSEAMQNRAEQRRKSLEEQLADSKYGIGYTDSTEKITQLNRAAENNLMAQVEYLTETVYNQLGLTEGIFDGTADEKAMLNYYNRTTEPVLAAIVDAMKRTFLTKTARTQGQTIMWFSDPFKLVPVASLAEIADKFTRNEILSSNEIRAIIGRQPSNDPKADELRNKNLNQAIEEEPSDQLPSEAANKDLEGDNENG